MEEVEGAISGHIVRVCVCVCVCVCVYRASAGNRPQRQRRRSRCQFVPWWRGTGRPDPRPGPGGAAWVGCESLERKRRQRRKNTIRTGDNKQTGVMRGCRGQVTYLILHCWEWSRPALSEWRPAGSRLDCSRGLSRPAGWMHPAAGGKHQHTEHTTDTLLHCKSLSCKLFHLVKVTLEGKVWEPTRLFAEN